ncbi:MAG: hypothetical protein AAGC64_03160 [Bacteroidota bacterium]
MDESGNLYALVSGATIPFSLLKIPVGFDDFDLGYEFVTAAVANPQNDLYPASAGFNYIGNDMAVACAVTEVPQALIDLSESLGGLENVTTGGPVLQIWRIVNEEEAGRWVTIYVVTQDVEIIQGVPAQERNGAAFSVVIDGAVYLSSVKDSENARYRYNPTTGAVEKAFDVIRAL